MCGGCGGNPCCSIFGTCNPCQCPPPAYPRCSPCDTGCGPRVCPPPCCGSPITINCIICKDPYQCEPCPVTVPLHVCGLGQSGGCC